ncbi:MAG: AraC family transcriptional regulator [bacterium]|nr:AraC family transcriptional regulator [bacterium]
MNGNTLYASELIHSAVGSNCHIERDIKNASPPHSHDYYEVFIILAGSCIHRVNDAVQQLKAGDMVFIRPDDTHSYEYAPGYTGTPCSFLNVNFIKESADSAFAYLDNREFVHALTKAPMPPVISLDAAQTEAMVKKSSQINVYEPINPAKARIAARSILIDMLTCFYLSYTQDCSEHTPKWFEELLLDVQRNNHFIYGLGGLTELSGKSPGHLNRMFKKYMGITPTEYINSLKLNYAKILLITTDMPIINASFEAGFDNLSHFYHLFKSMYGISPGQIRKNNTQNQRQLQS